MSRASLRDEFFDDFRSEATELLQLMAQLIAGLRGHLSAGSCDMLLRQLHTLKGLTSMVDLEEAAKLLHLLENALLPFREAGGVFDDSTSSIFERAILDLEQHIAKPQSVDLDLKSYELRLSQHCVEPNPESEPGIEQEAPEYFHLIPENLALALSEEDKNRIRSAKNSNLGIFVLEYFPNPEKAVEGQGINWIRERLEALGELLRVVPKVEKNWVRFSFLLIAESLPDLENLPLTIAVIVPCKDKTAEVSNYQFHHSTLRVELPRLESMMRRIEDLVSIRNRLDVRLGQLPASQARDLADVSQQLQRGLKLLTQSVVELRLVPLTELFSRMQLVVKDLGRETQREIRLRMSGEQTRIDKVLVDQLLDPLVHLVRNAVAHGLESSSERRAAGKPAVGSLHLHARSDGNQIVLSVIDDGRGVDSVGDFEKLLDQLCEPGYSTRPQAGLDAGRGLGMGIVRRAVQQLGGSMAMTTEAGKGTTFRLLLPVTVAMLEALLVEVSGRLLAVPLSDIEEIVEFEPGQLVCHDQVELLSHRGRVLPFYRLHHLLRGESTSGSQQFALIHRSTGAPAAFAVDRLAGMREMVIRSLTDPLVARPWFSGASELGDGRLALVLNLTRLLKDAA